jgi:hypothetical protein
VWGGYFVYRDKQPSPAPMPTGPTPLSAFHSSLSTLSRHLPMAEVVVGFEAKKDLRFTEAEFDNIDQWLKALSPDSVGARTDLSFIRRQVTSADVLLWHAQVIPPGPVLSLDKVWSSPGLTEFHYWIPVSPEQGAQDGKTGLSPRVSTQGS